MDFQINEEGVLIKYNGKDSVVNIPEGVKTIGESAFCCASNFTITEINFPNSVESIEENAFKNCCNVEVLKLPKSCKRLAPRAFYNCNGLKEIHIPGSVEVIPLECFASLENVRVSKKVYVGDGCKRIEKRAFDDGGYYYLPDSIEFIDEMAIEEQCTIYGHYKKEFIDFVMAEEWRYWEYYPGQAEIKKNLPSMTATVKSKTLQKITEHKNGIMSGEEEIKLSKKELTTLEPLCKETYRLYVETTGFFKRKQKAEYWEKYRELNGKIEDLKIKIGHAEHMNKWYSEQIERLEDEVSNSEKEALERLVREEREKVKSLHPTYIYKRMGYAPSLFVSDVLAASEKASTPQTEPATQVAVMPKIDVKGM